jgi:hypothetical protein
MNLISKQEVLNEINHEISKCPNHFTMGILQKFKRKIESMECKKSKRDSLLQSFLEREKEFEEFKKQFRA